MTPEEFDEAVYDLVNFLAYVGEPAGWSASAWAFTCCCSLPSSSYSPGC